MKKNDSNILKMSLRKLMHTAGVLVFLLSCFNGYSQQTKTVTGTVLEKDTSIPVAGAAIVEDGTTNGVVTDFDGNFIIEVSEGAMLRISYLGFGTQTVATTESTLTIYLEESGEQLDEVVIVGYGAQKKTDVTGSVSSLKVDEFNQGVVNAPEELLRAKIPGVRVTASSGAPGAANTITIRGAGALRSGDSPLYVIDGVPISNEPTSPPGGNILGTPVPTTSASSNPIAFLNPNDIASLDVLKDASATAIYGSRGSNGVILITTKRGKRGAPELNFSASTGFSSVANKLDVGTAADFGGGAIDTDWQDEIFQSALVQNYNLSYSAGGENSSYLVSLSAFDQEGIIAKSGLQRYSGRINSSFWALKDNKLKLDLNLAASQTEINTAPRSDLADTAGELITNTLGALPTRPVLDAASNFSSGRTNPVGLSELYNDITTVNRVLANLTATYKFTPNFSYQVNLGGDFSNGFREQEILPNNLEGVNNSNGAYSNGTIVASNLLFENFLTYSLTSGKSQFNFLLGYANQTFNLESNISNFVGFVQPNVSAIDNPANAPFLNGLPSGVNTRTRLESVFGRINYAYGDRFNATASLRGDSSSKFAEGNRLGIFPALAASYALIVNDSENAINALKARVGWGQTGNQNVPGNPTEDAFEFVQAGSTIGLTPVSAGNPDLTWEISTQFNIGLDFSLFKNRLSGSIDFFNKENTDLIFFAASEPPAVAGQFINLPGGITNTGLEIFLDYDVVKGEDFTWNISANATSISNEVQLRGEDEFPTGLLSGPGLNGTTVQVVRSGEALGSFLLPSANADGTVGDPEIQGTGIPDFVYGFSTTLNYKNWDFSANFSGVSGNQIYNNTAQFLANVGENAPTNVLNATNIPNEPSTFFLEDGAFLRLANTTLGYDVNVDSTKVFKKLRLYATGQNLFTITDYSGFDPEVSTPTGQNGVLSYGVDFGAYPRARTLIFGVNASF